jgi:protein associated with RNAse G/E
MIIIFILSDFDPENVMTMDEKKKLYDAIGYEDHQNSSSYPEEVDILFQIRDIESLMFKF